MKIKTIFKKSFAIFLILMLVVCTLSACSTKNSKTIVGKWYNSSGNCLDIRSDGSYKLEGNYGTGTWKFLEDDKTIEFLDFYGDSIETEIKANDGRYHIPFGIYGDFYKKDEESSSELISSIKLTKATTFSNGVAWISYNDEADIGQLALINSNGEILFKEQGSKYDLPRKSGLLSFVEGENENYKLITNNGNLVASTQGGKFDTVIDCGDGFALVYKFSGPKDSKHLYGIVDRNGDFVVDYINFNKKYVNGEYLGSSIFAIEIQYQKRWILLNAKTGKNICIAAEYFSDLPKFINDIAIFKQYFYILKKPDDYISYNSSAKSLEYCKMDTNFKTKKLKEFSKTSGNFVISCDEQDLKLILTNVKTNKKFKLDYTVNEVISIDYVENFALLQIKASDGNRYLTVLDADAKEQFQPIKYYITPKFSNGKIICQDYNKYNIIDHTGVTLAENLEYTNIFEFSEGIGVAEMVDDEYCYINPHGERVLNNIHE